MNRKNWIISICIAGLLLTACSSENTELPQEAKSQPVELALAVGFGNNATRQSSEVTQSADGQFRGIQDIVLIPLNNGTPLDGILYLEDLTNESKITLVNNAIAQLYQNVTLMTTTSDMLFYGKAQTPNSSSLTGENLIAHNHEYGALQSAGIAAGNPANISFACVPIYNNSTVPAEAQALADYVSSIVNTSGWKTETEPTMKTLYDLRMTHFTVGSSKNLLAALQNLYKKLKTITETNLIRDIIANMKIGTGETDVLTADENNNLSWNTAYTGTKMDNYPACYGLPDGAATMRWDETQEKYVAIIDGSLDNIGIFHSDATLKSVPLNRYCYPAELYYYINSPVMVSDESKEDKYVNNTTWGTILNEYADHSVDDNTASVALRDPVGYAVCRLDIAIRGLNTQDPSSTIIKDLDNREIQMSDLQLTGILVADQRNVDYAFAPIGTERYTVYDNQMINPIDPTNPITLATNHGKDAEQYIYTHTLVLPTAESEDVVLFFEFQNNTDDDITVKDGLVPKGCKFYLGGKIAHMPMNPSVFVSGTYAQISGSVSSLENAYNVVPPKEAVLQMELQYGLQRWTNKGETPHPVYNW